MLMLISGEPHYNGRENTAVRMLRCRVNVGRDPPKGTPATKVTGLIHNHFTLFIEPVSGPETSTFNGSGGLQEAALIHTHILSGVMMCIVFINTTTCVCCRDGSLGHPAVLCDIR